MRSTAGRITERVKTGVAGESGSASLVKNRELLLTSARRLVKGLRHYVSAELRAEDVSLQEVGSTVYGLTGGWSGADVAVEAPGADESLLKWLIVDKLRRLGCERLSFAMRGISTVIVGRDHRRTPVSIFLGESAKQAHEATRLVRDVINGLTPSDREAIATIKEWAHARDLMVDKVLSPFTWTVLVCSYLRREKETGDDFSQANLVVDFCHYLLARTTSRACLSLEGEITASNGPPVFRIVDPADPSGNLAERLDETVLLTEIQRATSLHSRGFGYNAICAKKSAFPAERGLNPRPTTLHTVKEGNGRADLQEHEYLLRSRSVTRLRPYRTREVVEGLASSHGDRRRTGGSS